MQEHHVQDGLHFEFGERLIVVFEFERSLAPLNRVIDELRFMGLIAWASHMEVRVVDAADWHLAELLADLLLHGLSSELVEAVS